MTPTKKKPKTLEQLFPDSAARTMADQVVDKMDAKLPMTDFLDAWDFRVAKKSPFRSRR